MSGPALIVEGLSKRFAEAGRHRRPLYRELLGLASRDESGSVEALRDVTFELPRGAAVALVGPNGAGKSTLMRSIAGIYRPSAGAVSVGGRVACYFEAGAGIAPTLPVLDNVFLYGAILGLGFGETRRSVESILAFAELEDQRHTRLEHLSFGTQQRLFFAIMMRTMHLRKAELFLFDEWLAGADLRFLDKGEAALADARHPETTTLYAGHDLDRLERMCELAVYLDEGRIRAFGPVGRVLRDYRRDAAAL